jgi:hypothetical protein
MDLPGQNDDIAEIAYCPNRTKDYRQIGVDWFVDCMDLLQDVVDYRGVWQVKHGCAAQICRIHSSNSQDAINQTPSN